MQTKIGKIIGVAAVVLLLTMAIAGAASAYTVTYDGNGATSGTVPSEQTGTSITISGNTGSLVKNGNVFFNGWNTEKDGKGTAYAPGTAVNENLTLYAQWATGYTELNYIEGDGTAYIDTGYVVNYTDLKTEYKYRKLNSITCAVYGVDSLEYEESTEYRNMDGYIYSTYGYYGSSKYGAVTIPQVVEMDYTVKFVINESQGYGKWNVNGVEYSNSSKGLCGWENQVSNTDSDYIFRSNAKMSYDGMSGYIYYLRYYKSGVLDREFIPCVNPSNEVGMYETVTGKFYGNDSASGSFTAGTVKTYPVTYDGNDADSGCAPVDESVYQSGQTLTVLGNTGNLTKSGYKFSGWKVGSSTSSDIVYPYQTRTMGTSKLMLYANWIAESTTTYSVTYDVNGGTGTLPVDGSAYESGKTVTVGSGYGFKKGEYVFTGWNTEADGTGTTYYPGVTFTIDKDITLYVLWGTVHMVTYDGNGATSGSVPVDSTAYIYNDQVTVLGNTGSLLKYGYKFFDGWTCDQNLGSITAGTLIKPGTTFTMPEADVTLKAQWATGYTELEYIEGDGTAYIDTGYVVNYTDLKTEYKYRKLDILDCAVYGVDSRKYELDPDNRYMDGYIYEKQGYYASSESGAVTGITQELGVDYTVEFVINENQGYGKWNVNGVEYSNSSKGLCGWENQTGNTSTDYIFRTNTIMSGNGMSGYIYYLRYYKSGVLDREFIPCTDSSGEVGMYETVMGKFFGNATSSGSFTAGYYPVTYDGNGADGGCAPVDESVYQSGQTLTVLGNTGNLTKSEYKFSGWKVGSSTSSDIVYPYQTRTMGTSKLMLYANWIDESTTTYSVTYDVNGGTGTLPVDGSAYQSGQTVTVGSGIGLTSQELVFAEWNSAADGKGTSYKAGETFTIGSDITLYAIYARVHTVTYDANGATGGCVPVDSTAYVYNDQVTVLGNTGSLLKYGYKFFDGWTCDQNLGSITAGTLIKPGTTFTMPEADVTLKAHWATGFSEVEYIEGDGTAYIDTEYIVNYVDLKVEYKYMKYTSLQTNPFGYDGYSSDGSTRLMHGNVYATNGYYGDSSVVTGITQSLDTDYEVVFQIDDDTGCGIWNVNNKSYSVSSKGMNGWTHNNVYGQTYSDYIFATSNKGSPEYNMTGRVYYLRYYKKVDGAYNLERNFIPCVTPVGVVGMYETVTGKFYGNASASGSFTTEYYPVTYNGNGADGGCAPVDDTTYTSGDTVTVLGNTGDLTKSGCIFAGWTLDPEGTGTVYGPDTEYKTYTFGTENVTFYAKWTDVLKYYVYIPSGVTLQSTPVNGTYKIKIVSASADDKRKVVLEYNQSSHEEGGVKYVTLDNGTPTDDTERMSYTVTLPDSSDDIQQGDCIVSVPATDTSKETILTYSEVDSTDKKAGSYSDTLSFTVSVTGNPGQIQYVESITISGDSKVNIGNTVSLTATVSPDTATDKTVTWSSSNESVATVDQNGEVTGVDTGVVTIRASANDNSGVVGMYQVWVGIDNLYMIAHRGLSASAPENTLIATKLACEDSRTWAVDCDEWKSSDGVFMVSHDNSLSRMCGVAINITASTREEIQKHPITGGTNVDKYPTQYVPTLAEWLDLVNDYDDVVAEIHLRASFTDDDVTNLLAVCDAYLPRDRVVLIHDDTDALLKLRDANTGEKKYIVQILGSSSADFKWALENGIDACMYYGVVNSDMVASAKANNIFLSVYTVNSVNDIYTMASYGVEYIISDWGASILDKM